MAYQSVNPNDGSARREHDHLRMVRTWAVLRLVQLALLAAPERPGAGGASATRPDTTLPVRRDFAGRGIVRAGFTR